MTAPTPTEQATLDRFEAAADAEESFRERMADAMYDELDSFGLTGEITDRASEFLADAAIAVIRGQR